MLSVLFLFPNTQPGWRNDYALVTVIANSKREAMTQLEIQRNAQWHDPNGPCFGVVLSETEVKPGNSSLVPMKFKREASCAG